jgi:3-oxoacyl-[acyl-carrier-protein] synthase III
LAALSFSGEKFSLRKDLMQRYLNEVELVSTGVYLPGEPIPFNQIEDFLGHLKEVSPVKKRLIDKLRPQMKEKIGIKQCHLAIDPVTKQINETHTSMSVKAINQALARASMKASEIDCLILADLMPDTTTPPTTTLVQEQLQLENCAEFEIHSNCTGSTKAIEIAFNALQLGRYKNVAVCMCQLSSFFLQSAYFNQEKVESESLLLRWFLSDSASAMILKATDKIISGLKLVDVYNRSIGGKLATAMWLNVGASNMVLPEVYDRGDHHMGQNYAMVNELAPDLISIGIKNLMDRCQLTVEDVDHFVSTSPSAMLYERGKLLLRDKLGIPTEKWFSSVAEKGYSGASSVIIGLHDALNKNILKTNETLIVSTIESSKWMVGAFALQNVNGNMAHV